MLLVIVSRMQRFTMNVQMAALRVRCEAARKNWTNPDGIMKNQALLSDISDQMSIMCDKKHANGGLAETYYLPVFEQLA